MSAILTQWRTTYAPGEWIAVAGPTSLVVLQPSATGWTPLLETLWEAVLASASLGQLATKLAAHGIEDMPSFGAFFWTPEGMRSLVRGEVRVRDASTGGIVADGQGIQTWNEIGLRSVDRIRVETPASGEDRGLQLPLVVGVALASSLALDASPDASVRSPQGAKEEDDTEPMDPPLPHEAVAPLTETLEETPPAARLVLSDGTTVDLTQPVRIGRAPSGGEDGHEVVLVTVRSPQQDISRTHVQVMQQDGQVIVTDLNSTNGTHLIRPGMQDEEELLAPGLGVPVEIGSVLELGDGVRVRIEPPLPSPGNA